MIIRIAWKNILSKPLHSGLCWILLTLGVGMIALLFLIEQQIDQQLHRNSKPVDMVIGAKGSPLQLVLSAVYHIDAPTGNISLAEANKWINNPSIERAVPLAYGDSYEGRSIVGTNPDYLQLYEASIAQGQLFENEFEVVAGSRVAEQLGLKIGSTFYSTHGAEEQGEKHEDHAFRITGILKPNGTVVDHLLLCSIASVWEIHEHEEAVHSTQNDSQAEAGGRASQEEVHEPEITAALIKFRDPMAFMQLPRLINEQSNLMAALPAIEINRLLTLFEAAIHLLKNLGWGIMSVAALSIFVALYNSLKDRKYELALIRTMGAARTQLLLLLLTEGLLLGIAGAASGIILSRLAAWILLKNGQHAFQSNIGQLSIINYSDVWLLTLAITISLLAALLPAVRAFTLNISKTLSHG